MLEHRNHHISSAVVSTLPGRTVEVIEAIEAMPDAEVHAHESGKIVVVIEGDSTRALGNCLTQIAALEGVITANMVFEQIEKMEVPADEGPAQTS
ncbi:MAG: glutamate synthase [Ahrensia sp.]|nr:glutamate synthase [Ahrensia sp.]|tara:strand:- start:20754 stop:21038 length:285 start_codon:yes stop_codon:yes gene_type:complete